MIMAIEELACDGHVFARKKSTRFSDLASRNRSVPHELPKHSATCCIQRLLLYPILRGDR